MKFVRFLNHFDDLGLPTLLVNVLKFKTSVSMYVMYKLLGPTLGAHSTLGSRLVRLLTFVFVRVEANHYKAYVKKIQDFCHCSKRS